LDQKTTFKKGWAKKQPMGGKVGPKNNLLKKVGPKFTYKFVLKLQVN